MSIFWSILVPVVITAAILTFTYWSLKYFDRRDER